MFARPKPAKLNRRHNLAETEKTFTKIIGPAVAQSTLSSSNLFANINSNGTNFNQQTTGTFVPQSNQHQQQRFARTGDGLSYTYNMNDTNCLDRRMSQRGYRVLAYREDRNGRKVVFDVLDGTVYHCGVGNARKITNNAVIFDTKSAAMSERFPANQFGGSIRSGNGVCPRVLVQFGEHHLAAHIIINSHQSVVNSSFQMVGVNAADG